MKQSPEDIALLALAVESSVYGCLVNSMAEPERENTGTS
jgi:hypothetical protein